MTDSELARVTQEAAEAGAAIALAAYRGELNVSRKSGKTDVVTETDHAAQASVIEHIEARIPDSTIVGEEEGTAEELPDEGIAWLIDPIDGTANFVRELPMWATSVACLVDGEPVAAANVVPAVDDRYYGTPDGVTRNGEPMTVSDQDDPDAFLAIPTLWWGRNDRAQYAAMTRELTGRFGDIRRIGSAQIELSTVAGGSVEGVVSNVIGDPWDTVAGAAMIEWAGGTVTDIFGDPWGPESHGIVASNGVAHDTFCAAARAAEDARRMER